MGINGLLGQLKSISRPAHVGKYKGKRVAVDTYCWLHKAAFSCAKELCLGIPTTRYIDYCMHRVNLMKHGGVIPVLVFDGGKLPMKAGEEAGRERSRKEYLDKANVHMQNGNQAAAHECWQRAVDISPEMAARLIQVLKKEGVDYVVAPYEADAQMAHMAILDDVYAVITEDSDLLPYGCKRVLFKMDKFGNGQEVSFDDLPRAKELSFVGFTPEMFLEMCVMSGCDFLPQLPGIGIKKAHSLMRRFRCYKKAIKHLRYDGVHVPRDYEPSFQRALWTFRHQRVWCPKRGALAHVRDVVDPALLALGDNIDFLGPEIEPSAARGIAEGVVDPMSKAPFALGEVPAAGAPRAAAAPGGGWWGGGGGGGGAPQRAGAGGGRGGGAAKGASADANTNTLAKYFGGAGACAAAAHTGTRADARKEFKRPRGAGGGGNPFPTVRTAGAVARLGEEPVGPRPPPAAGGSIGHSPFAAFHSGPGGRGGVAAAGPGAGGLGKLPSPFAAFSLSGGGPVPAPARAAEAEAASSEETGSGSGGRAEEVTDPSSPPTMVSPIRRNPLAWNRGGGPGGGVGGLKRRAEALVRTGGPPLPGPRKTSKFFSPAPEPEMAVGSDLTDPVEVGGAGEEIITPAMAAAMEEEEVVEEEGERGRERGGEGRPASGERGRVGGGWAEMARPGTTLRPDLAPLRGFQEDAKGVISRAQAETNSLEAFRHGGGAGARKGRGQGGNGGQRGQQSQPGGSRGKDGRGQALENFKFFGNLPAGAARKVGKRPPLGEGGGLNRFVYQPAG